MVNESSPLLKAIDVPLTTLACVYCVVVFVALNLAGENGGWEVASRWGYLPDIAVWTGKPWALITSSFVHIDFLHLAFNVYWLWVLGSCFEKNLGWWQWLLFFLGAAWVSAAAELFLGGSSGIGMSGVGYALFAFGWLARTRIPDFAAIVDDQTVKIFLGWLVLCVVLTQLNIMQIANWAHAFGLVFGAIVAALFILHWRPWLPAIDLCALLAASFVPLQWSPFSGTWTSLQATQAFEREDYDTAVYWYRRSLALGEDPTWAWSNIALIYGYQEKQVEYRNALQELRKTDTEAAKEVAAEFGGSASTN